jgi:radical SAM protein with 4Fe4S-binding SPASM domain
MTITITAPKFPLAAIWEVTQQCNFQCEHCSSSAGQESGEKELSPAKALDLIEELATFLQVYRLVISGGEPLLRRDVFAIMRKASEYGLKVSLFTNGTLLTDPLLDQLDDIALDYLQIGLPDMPSANDSPFLKISDTIKNAQSHTYNVGVSVPVHKKTFQKVVHNINILLDLEIDSLCLSRFVPTGRGALFAEDLVLSLKQRKKLALLGHNLREQGYTIILDEPLTDPYGCQAGITLCGISSAGDVYPCPLLRKSIGNVTVSPITELWQKSQLIADLKKRHLKGHCGACDLKATCGGCRSLAFYTTGDCLAADPQCWLNPLHHTEDSF